MINEISMKQDQEMKNENQLMIIVQTNDEINSFRTSLTFEVKKEAMTFANYSDQRSLLL